ncbi:MAG: hypothetical protein M3173_01455 [Chloroflexota bacterium]|nr:hypothetical protein [Chloroflexota bacterium]
MVASEQAQHTLPSSGVPYSRIPWEWTSRGLRLRRFGDLAEDLSVDFDSASPPHLVTTILATCTESVDGEPPSNDWFWDLTVGTRITALLTLATDGGTSDLGIALRCANARCQGEMELFLSLDECIEEQERMSRIDHIEVDLVDARFTIRKPTGSDQLAWASETFASEDAALEAMLKTLIEPDEVPVIERSGQSPNTWIALAGEALEEIDPLVSFTIITACPDCGLEHECPIDLQDLALRTLRGIQERLIIDIHQLATHYHWSEADILVLPAWRRSRYLSLLRDEVAR